MDQGTFYYNRSYLDSEEDKIVRTWTILRSPILPAVFVPIYLLVVSYGPKLMKNRKPFSLRKTIMAYNMVQVIFNFHIVAQYFAMFGSFSLYVWKCPCYPVTAANGNILQPNNVYLEAIKLYYFTKFVDLFDTLFFILRKKDNQITFLHVYHHAGMIVFAYLSVIVAREEIYGVFSALNSLVHVIMYSYYFLAAMGPHIQKYLWWKKYITKVQMVQFIISIALLIEMAVIGCETKPITYGIWLSNLTIFFFLFLNFYTTSYVSKKTK